MLYISDIMKKELVESRENKIKWLKENGISLYPNRYDKTGDIAEIKEKFEKEGKEFKTKTAGRLMLVRMHGKAGFADIRDHSDKMQIYVRQDFVGEEGLAVFKNMDIGDIIGVEGEVFKTRTEEVTIKVEKLHLLSKSLLPLPEKFHGLKDIELRYRKRYLDLIMNSDVRDIFKTRSKVVSTIRKVLTDRDFFEVETPMMQPIYGGASAKPFVTHHNTLDMKLFLRIAPELYLKRLIVGGFERVFEINRNFRNEGISNKHNPEFTMLELYQAYSDYNGMMFLCKEIIETVVKEIKGSTTFEYQGQKIDVGGEWKSLSLIDSVKEICGKDFREINKKEAKEIANELKVETDNESSKWDILDKIFSEKVEPNLIQPTFITDYPKAISPLAKSKPDDPDTVERFEPYICGMEIGNAFSELNDPEEQKKRFEEQRNTGEKPDDGSESYPVDYDYVEALSYGMPPTGGMGIGIDRLVILLADVPTIRDVILFPLMKQK